MTLYLLSFVAGALTLLSPCVLPVLPFVLAGSGQPLHRGALPLLAGMATTFSLVASLSVIGGEGAVHLGVLSRNVGLAWLAGVGLSLLFPTVTARLLSPLATLGNKLPQRRPGTSSWKLQLLTGVATGFVWAPCAGPVLGFVLSTAALGGSHSDLILQLLSYGAGAAVVLMLAITAGGRLMRGLRQLSAVTEGLKRLLGAAMVVAAVGLASGLSNQALLQLPSQASGYLESRLIRAWMPPNAFDSGQGRLAEPITDDPPPARAIPVAWGFDALASNVGAARMASGFEGATQWFNSAPISGQTLRGKVVLVSFWTYSCINCLRTLPFVQAWALSYASQGLAVVGVHTPEFAFEKDAMNVARAVKDLHVDYPVAQDNDFKIWNAFGNRYWPAIYVVDAQGRIRHRQFGEDGAAETERVIQALLREAGNEPVAVVPASTAGVGMPADQRNLRSPESYIGYAQSTAMASPERTRRNSPATYSIGALRLNEWALAGTWTVAAEFAELNQAGGALAVRFHARDMHLVMGADPAQPVRFALTIDGHAPGDEHGVDVDAQGNGTVVASRLYQLVRLKDATRDRRVEIRFLSPGVRAYALTFG